jgi:hypothetical protein
MEATALDGIAGQRCAVDVPELDLSAYVLRGLRGGPSVLLWPAPLPPPSDAPAMERSWLPRAAVEHCCATLDLARLRGRLIVVAHAANDDVAVHLLTALGAPALWVVEVHPAAPTFLQTTHLQADLDHVPSRRWAARVGELVVRHRPPEASSLRGLASARGAAAIDVIVGAACTSVQGAMASPGRALAALTAPVRRVLDATGCLAHPNRPAGPDPRPPRRLFRSTSELALPGDGWVEPLVRPGDHVERGQPIALLVEAPTEAAFTPRPLTAPRRGVILSITLPRRAVAPAIYGELLPVARRTRGVAATNPSPAAASVAPRALPILSWSAPANLPELGLYDLPAKLDTGADGCALHLDTLTGATGWTNAPRGPRGEALAEATSPPGTALAIEGHINVRDSGGHLERRPFITTMLEVGSLHRRVRISLTNRGDMTYPLLVGRAALAGRALVDPTPPAGKRKPPAR